MKVFTIFLLLISNFIFGQEFIIGSSFDSTFINFSNTVFSLNETRLGIQINPLRIIEIQEKHEYTIIRFELKYVHTIGDAPSFNELEDNRFNKPIYWCSLFGTEYMVIALSRNTGSMNDVKYYYQLIK